MRSGFYFWIFICLALAACNGNGSSSSEKDTAQSLRPVDSAAKLNTYTIKAIAPLPPVPNGAKVYFISPKNRATVTSPLEIEMGVNGMKVEPAGAVVARVGHHHLIIDAGNYVEKGIVIPKNESHIHFGNGQTKATIKLLPGTHRLTLQFADGIHRSYGKKMAATIKITVK